MNLAKCLDRVREPALSLRRTRLLLAMAIALGSTGPAAATDIFEVIRYHQPGDGSVNTFILESAAGVVVIDAQRTLSAGGEVAAEVARIGKPLQAILITHPHPDHVNGLGALLAAYPGTPVYASVEARDEMRTDGQGYFAMSRQLLGDDASASVALPTTIFGDGDTLEFGDIALVVDEIGPGESVHMAMFYAPDLNVLFTGDLIDNEMIGFALEGRTSEWLEQLAAVRRDYGDRQPLVYPGHGDVGAFEELLDAQTAWLTDLRRLVGENLDDGPLTDDEVAEILVSFTELHPSQLPVAPIPGLMELNVRAVAEELHAE